MIIRFTPDHHFTSLHFTLFISVPITSLHINSLHSLHFSSHHLSSHQFTSLHSLHFSSPHLSSHQFTSLHYKSLPIFHFPALLAVPSALFKNPSFLLTYNIFLTVFLKTYDLLEKVADAFAGSWFHGLIVLFTKEYLPITMLCFLALILRS